MDVAVVASIGGFLTWNALQVILEKEFTGPTADGTYFKPYSNSFAPTETPVNPNVNRLANADDIRDIDLRNWNNNRSLARLNTFHPQVDGWSAGEKRQLPAQRPDYAYMYGYSVGPGKDLQ